MLRQPSAYVNFTPQEECADGLNEGNLYPQECAEGPYGEDWGRTGTNSIPFGWLGSHGVFHPGNGSLYLTRHRAYDTTLKRVLSSDPIGIAGGGNLYAYANGNPLSYIDALGLCGTGDGSSIRASTPMDSVMGVVDYPINVGRNIWNQFIAAPVTGTYDASSAFVDNPTWKNGGLFALTLGLNLASVVDPGLSPEARAVSMEMRAVSTDIKVLGRLEDTAVAKGWSGHDVLDIPNWTPQKNMQWVDEGIANKQPFYTASPQAGNMVQTAGPFKGQPTVFAQELQRIQNAGYNKVGDYYVSPNLVGVFKP